MNNLKKIQEEKLEKAKNLKMEKLRHKSTHLISEVLIEENKKKELRKKMQSAGFIRKDRGKAKVFVNRSRKYVSNSKSKGRKAFRSTGDRNTWHNRKNMMN